MEFPAVSPAEMDLAYATLLWRGLAVQIDDLDSMPRLSMADYMQLGGDGRASLIRSACDALFAVDVEFFADVNRAERVTLASRSRAIARGYHVIKDQLKAEGAIADRSNISKKSSEIWHSLPEEEHKRYKDMAAAEMAALKAKHPDYSYQPKRKNGSKVGQSRSAQKQSARRQANAAQGQGQAGAQETLPPTLEQQPLPGMLPRPEHPPS
ncbi:hypothetical protein GGR56DRAFT_693510 [Xylariaceae sp. FL0804]|nr:hypothetical protein GGR56DRAFT_693510 [Xylariaceae sp. FL0804]